MTTTTRKRLLVLLGVAGLGACSGEAALRCEDAEYYHASRSVPPVRVPDGLTVPDESQALEIPPGESLPVRDEEDPPGCLELPPDFFDESAEPTN